jgi:hypothetical protein
VALAVGADAAGHLRAKVSDDPAMPKMLDTYTCDYEMTATSNVAKNVALTGTQWWDLTQHQARSDIATEQGGNDAGTTVYSDYANLHDYPNPKGIDNPIQVPYEYSVDPAAGTCCYAPMVDQCDQQGGCVPSTMFTNALPYRTKFMGTITHDDKSAIPEGTTADWWEADMFGGMVHQMYYFDAADHTTLIGDGVYVDAQGQTANITDVYPGGYVAGPIDASTFDYSSWDCSAQCQTNSEQMNLLNAVRAGRRQKQKVRA